MDIRKLKTLDDAIKINEIQHDKPYRLVVIKASIELALYEHYSPEFWDVLSEEAKEAYKDQLKDYLKEQIIELVAKEVENQGISHFEIQCKPVKHIHVNEDKCLVLLDLEQMLRLNTKYVPALRDIE